MNKFILTAAPACATFLLQSSVLAGEAVAPTTMPETVVISASPFGQDAIDATANVSQISRQELIVTGGFGLGDALKSVPGVTTLGVCAGRVAPGDPWPWLHARARDRERARQPRCVRYQRRSRGPDRSAGRARGGGAARTRHAALRQPGDRRGRQRDQQPHTAQLSRKAPRWKDSPASRPTASSVSPARSPTTAPAIGRSTPTASFAARTITTRPTARS